MNTLGERLHEVMRELKIESPRELAKFCAVSEGLVSQWFSGQTKLGPKPLKALAKTHFNLNWITDGDLPKYRSDINPRHNAEEPVLEAVTIIGRVPLISWVQAGAFCEATDPYNVGDAEEWFSCPVRHGPRTYALRVRGESMRNPGSKPSFEDGDIIFVDPDRGASHKSLVITKLDQSNEVTFKRLLIDGMSWYLEALNPAWPNRIIPIKVDAHVCGVVIARMESFV